MVFFFAFLTPLKHALIVSFAASSCNDTAPARKGALDHIRSNLGILFLEKNLERKFMPVALTL